MKRVSRIRIAFDSNNYKGKRGNFAEAIVTNNGVGLTRDEAQSRHDEAVDKVVEAIRTLPYTGTAPLRSVRIRNGA